MDKNNLKYDTYKTGLFFRKTFNILKNPIAFLGHLSQSYGPIVKIHIAGKKYLVLQHPESIKHVLLDNHKTYHKRGITKILRFFFGEGLVTSNGELWYKKRRLIQLAFHKQRLSHILGIINEETSFFIEKLETLPSGSRLNISDEMLQLNVSIISRAMFSAPLEEDKKTMMNVLEELTTYASSWMKSMIKIPLSWPTPANRKFHQNCKVFDTMIYKMVNERIAYRANSVKPPHEDLLDMLLDYVDEDSLNEMTKKQIRDEVTTIFMAGHDTTAQTLSWIFYELAKDKDISRKVTVEASHVLPKELSGLEVLSHLHYTKKVIQEGLRYYPSISAILRKPICDDVIFGTKVQVSTNILINIYGMHHHPDYWENPEIFDPERFSAAKFIGIKPFVYLPFGGGPRLCIGSNFAMMVMQVVVSSVCERYEFDVMEGYIPEIDPNITLKAKGGIPLILKKL